MFNTSRQQYIKTSEQREGGGEMIDGLMALMERVRERKRAGERDMETEITDNPS